MVCPNQWGEFPPEEEQRFLVNEGEEVSAIFKVEGERELWANVTATTQSIRELLRDDDGKPIREAWIFTFEDAEYWTTLDEGEEDDYLGGYCIWDEKEEEWFITYTTKKEHDKIQAQIDAAYFTER